MTEIKFLVVFTEAEKTLYKRIIRLEQQHGKPFEPGNGFLRYIYYAGKGKCQYFYQLHDISHLFKAYTVEKLLKDYGIEKVLPYLREGCQFPKSIFDLGSYQVIYQSMGTIFCRRCVFIAVI